MKMWYDVVREAWKAYYYQDTPGARMRYLYGAKGEYITKRSQVEYYFNAEPAYFSKYSSAEKEEIIADIISNGGAFCYDCSGFVSKLNGDWQYSTAQYQSRSFEAPSIAEGVAGSFLYKDKGGRHIGVDVGYGFCLHMGAEPTKKNVANGRSGVVLDRLADQVVKWEHSFQGRTVDYTGATNH